MKAKRLLTLFAVPLFCLASCDSADWNMYSQTIKYEKAYDNWSEVETNTNKTVKQIFYDYFDSIDWTKSSEVKNHSTADEAYNSIVNEMKTEADYYSKVKIVTDAKGTGTFTVDKQSVKVNFEIKQDDPNQNVFTFYTEASQAAGAVKILKWTNHNIQQAIVNVSGHGPSSTTYTIQFKDTESGGTSPLSYIPITYTFNFIS